MHTAEVNTTEKLAGDSIWTGQHDIGMSGQSKYQDKKDRGSANQCEHAHPTSRVCVTCMFMPFWAAKL